MSRLWINGELIDKADARISPFDHGFLFGDGVWEPLRVFNGKLCRAEEHVQTLLAAAAALGIDIPMSPAELIAAIAATIRANDRTDGYVRVIATRGAGTLGPDPRKLDPQLIIIAEEYQPFPRELYEHGLHAITVPGPCCFEQPWQRIRMLGNPRVVQAKRAALQAGCLEALFMDASNNVAAGTEGQLFRIRGGEVLGPPGCSGDMAAGVVRDLCAALPAPFAEQPTTREELLGADEAFLAGTSCGIIGIVRVDGAAIGSGREGAFTRRIREAYRRLTAG